MATRDLFPQLEQLPVPDHLGWSSGLREEWIFDLAEREPERLLEMTDEEFRTAMAEAGFDADALIQRFHISIAALLTDKKNKDA